MPRKHRFVLLFSLLLFLIPTVTNAQEYVSHGALKFSPNDWPCWRGPHQDGIANPDQTPPQSWSETDHIAWKSPVPGRGHGSPCVCGGHIYLATCDEQVKSQSVLCYDRETGNQLWQTEVHPSGAMWKNKLATGASSTVACDGERLYINFPNSNALYTTALSLGGEIVWQRKVDDYKIHQGYGASPALYKSLVIVTADNKSGGAVAGLDRKTGDIVWTRDRPKLPNYASPIIYHLFGKDQLILTGTKLVTSLDPMTGEELWETAGATEECVTSTVTDGVHVYSSGGYPKNHIAAVKADGSKELAWEIGDRVYVPSMVMHEGYIYAVKDAGVALCLKADTGEEMWQGRIGGNFYATVVLVGDLVYATNQAGETTIFKADPTGFSVVAKNRLGDEQFSTPTICGGKIYMRVAHRDDDQRQEMLYCIE
jgi:outer membrane protein assembly factor BamB